jgi:hypothetical protein
MKLTPSDIKLYKGNAKKHPDSQLLLLAKVVKEVGWRQNVEVNQEGVIVAGHGRWLAWQKYAKEYSLPDVWVTDDKGNTIMGKHADFPLTPAQEKMWRLADNQLNAMTEVDMALAIPDIAGLDWDMIELTGYNREILENVAVVDDPYKEWNSGMPDFDIEDKTSYRHVIVHFKNEENVQKFFSLIGQKDTGKTKSIWFPEEPNMDTESKRYA